MASPTVSSLAIFTPFVASNAIFSARRASRGVEAMDENPVLGAMNMTIAGAQVLKGVNAGADAAKLASPSFAKDIQTASESIKKLSDNSKIVKYAGKGLKFVADNINPIICLAGGVKVLGSEDKVDAGVRETLALGTMFLAEDTYKYLVGMPKTADGKLVRVESALYKNKKFRPFLEKQVKALNDTCATKKLFNKISLKTVPGLLKGVGFAIASIVGYKVGSALANCFLGKPKEVKEKEN